MEDEFEAALRFNEEKFKNTEREYKLLKFKTNSQLKTIDDNLRVKV